MLITKQGKVAALHRLLDVKGNLNLINLNLFQLTKNKKGIKFCKGNKKWVSLTKQLQPDKLFALKKVKWSLVGYDRIKCFLGTDQTPPVIDWSMAAITNLICYLLTGIEMESILYLELLSLAEDTQIKIQEAHHKKLILKRNKILQAIQDELESNTSNY